MPEIAKAFCDFTTGKEKEGNFQPLLKLMKSMGQSCFGGEESLLRLENVNNALTKKDCFEPC